MDHPLLDKRDRIVTITFNRPEQRKAYPPDMAVNLTRYLRDCEKVPEVRVVINTGAGDLFCVPCRKRN